MRPYLPFVFFLFYVIPNFASAQSFLKNEMPFLHARKLLMKNGWMPFDSHSKTRLKELGTQEKILIEKGIQEVDTCSMDAGGICNLFYNKKIDICRFRHAGKDFA